MTIKIHDYKLLEDFKKEQRERSEKLMQYQQDAQGAQARLVELKTQYEYTFTQSVKEGKDATAELEKIDRAASLLSIFSWPGSLLRLLAGGGWAAAPTKKARRQRA